MRKYCEENERVKRRYMEYLKQAKGQDQKTIDKVAAALVKFEDSTKFKPFKKFHIDQAGKFKSYLENARHPNTKKPLSLSTTDATLRLVKGFFHWLAGQPGYKSKISYTDVEYFNNNAKNARVAHAQRYIPFPSISASLKLKHINLFEGLVFQDGRDVKTKNSKTFTTWFFPVDNAYRECFDDWVNYLQVDKMFGKEDALFPKPKRVFLNGWFSFNTLSRENYANSSKINAVVRNAFAMVQLPEYTAHSFRKTLGHYMSDLQLTIEEQKAWSQNLGHDNFSTTISAYLPVSSRRQGVLIKSLNFNQFTNLE